MDIQIWDKLLLLLAGGVLTVLGAWLNDLRSERRRKAAKLEEAYLTWLNTQSSVLDRLKELTKLVEHEPESARAHELLLEKFNGLQSELQNLSCALNLAFIYERDRKKKATIEVQLLLYAQVAESLSLILRHHQTHLNFRTLIDKTNDLVLDYEEMAKTEEARSNVNLANLIAELHQQAQLEYDKASKYLSKCIPELCTEAKEISKDIKEIEEQSPVLRRMLVE